jgi:GAF domain-containing protein
MRDSEETPTDSLRRSCRVALESFGADRVSLWAHDAPARTFSLVAMEDGSGDVLGDGPTWPGVIEDDFHSATQVLSERLPQVISDPQANGYFPGSLARDLDIIGPVLLVPLFFGGPVGVLAIEPPADRDLPSSDPAVALAAATLGGLQVRHEAAQLRSDTQLLLELTAELAHEESLSRAVGSLCERLGQHMGVQIALVFTAENDRYVPRVARRWDGTDLTPQIDLLPAGLPPFGLIEAVGGSGMASVVGADSPLVPARWAETLGLGSAVAVPLGARRPVAGVCLLYTAEPRPFSNLEVRVASAAAAQLAGPLERSRSLDEHHFNKRAASVVRRLFEDSSRAVSLEEAAEALARVARDASGTEQVTIYIQNSEARLSHVLGVGMPPGGSARLGDSLVGMPVRDFPIWHLVAERTEPVFVEDPRLSPLLSQEAAATLGLASYIAVPLRSPEGLIGMALCNNVTEHRTWSEEQRRLVTQLAYEGSMILENALLRAADHERLHELAYQTCAGARRAPARSGRSAAC